MSLTIKKNYTPWKVIDIVRRDYKIYKKKTRFSINYTIVYMVLITIYYYFTIWYKYSMIIAIINTFH